MQTIARGLAERGIRVVRFEFPYMHERRAGGKRRAPDREPVLRAAWAEVGQADASSEILIRALFALGSNRKEIGLAG